MGAVLFYFYKSFCRWQGWKGKKHSKNRLKLALTKFDPNKCPF
jgi:hypothetical protein